ncbi:MAG: DUF4976 domain-containing protein, partial [Verrucomicrobia bacterium]|nr:DUF4976 domain-containing protein [Verrucomicrobiota bacterium]
GLAIGSHGLFGKQNLYDHSMHAPLIFAGPGILGGRPSGALSYLFDIFPTLGGLAGVVGPEGSEGRSLVAILRGEKEVHRASILTAYKKVQRAVRDDRWKLIVYPQINKTQLFDLKKDPGEVRDLAGMPEYAEEVRRMKGLLEKEQANFSDTLALSSATPEAMDFDFSHLKGKKQVRAIE